MRHGKSRWVIDSSGHVPATGRFYRCIDKKAKTGSDLYAQLISDGHGSSCKTIQGVFNAGCSHFIFFVLPGLLRSVVIVVSPCARHHFTFCPWLDSTTEFLPVLFRDADFRPDLQGGVETMSAWRLKTGQLAGLGIDHQGENNE